MLLNNSMRYPLGGHSHSIRFEEIIYVIGIFFGFGNLLTIRDRYKSLLKCARGTCAEVNKRLG